MSKKENNLTLTELTKFLNSHYTKKTGEKFTTGDTQGYIRRGSLPDYMGEVSIEKNDSIPGVKLYNLF